jgi:hypothetical protein
MSPAHCDTSRGDSVVFAGHSSYHDRWIDNLEVTNLGPKYHPAEPTSVKLEVLYGDEFQRWGLGISARQSGPHRYQPASRHGHDREVA